MQAMRKNAIGFIFLALLVTLVAAPALGENGRILGRVSEEQVLFGMPIAGDPISGATITVTGTTQTATTDADGKYNLSLPEGNYTLKVTATGFIDKTTSEVAVTANNTTTANVLLSKPRGNLTGKVTDEAGNPIAMTSLEHDDGSLLGISTYTATDGTYTLKGLPVGTISIKVTPFAGSPFNISVTIANGQTTTKDITVKTPVIVKVVDPDESPIAGASVNLGELSGTTDVNGTVTLQTKPGTYTLTVSAPGYATYSKPATVDKGGNIFTVTISKGSGTVDTGLIAMLFGAMCLLFLVPLIIFVVVIVAVIMYLRKRKRDKAAQMQQSAPGGSLPVPSQNPPGPGAPPTPPPPPAGP